MKIKNIKDAAKKKAAKSEKVIDIDKIVKKKEEHTRQLAKLKEVRTIARRMGIDTRNVTMTELIRAVQIAEGNNPCFATFSAQNCGQMNCLWRVDCK